MSSFESLSALGLGADRSCRMTDRRDIVDIEGVANPAGIGRGASAQESSRRAWLGIYFKCCRVYGRIYKNRACTEYVGQCPRCRSEVRALIGAGGTNKRFFEAG